MSRSARTAVTGRRRRPAAPLEPAHQAVVDELRGALPELTHTDRGRLRRRLDAVRSTPAAGREVALAGLAGDVDAARRRVAARRDGLPVPSYPPELPVSRRKDDLLAAIRDHQVVIVAGETGSGKTTQLPKICLELGRGVQGMVGHTQPRRLAARAVAERIAEELGTPLGDAVGYTVRFTDRVSDSTYVKVMTDGILLAEIQRDPQLWRYDTLIVDEAHERSLNVDFILGYLKQLLPRRPDLKVIITSATIDPARFSRHFDDAPVVEVSGRTYPVEVRYRPLIEAADDDDDEADGVAVDVVRDQTQAIVDAVAELSAEGPGDILVFLSGEREIRDTADALERLELRHTEVLPLFARLSAADQHRVFSPHTGRRIVLATNVAETSLTVPGIRYVVDPGTARISRYSHRTKVQRLPIEPISQASARQRAGRCGRVADGICIRLYAEADYESRPAFTDPEILRTNLASVILQMTAIGLGDVAAFPFVDPPDRRSVTDGVQLLHELGAIDPAQADPRKRLTDVGRALAQLPIDPRLGRMVLAAEQEHGSGVGHDVLVIAAALSIQDPRERPADHEAAATQSHARFVGSDPAKRSDFLTYLNLWRYLAERQDELSSSQFRRMCKREYLHYLRVREWQDLYGQLRSVVRGLGIAVRAPSGPAADWPEPDADGIHRALLAGLLSHVGMREGDGREYLGARGAKFAVFPGSALFRSPPRWVMAAELVETSRLWARINARIDPDWVESLAEHLVRRSYSEPHWEKDRGQVMAFEKVTLYGVPIVASRKIGYGRVDPELSRELFIRHALVEGDWRTHHRFFHENRALLAEAEELEHRARRRDIVVDDEALFDFYDRRVPAEVVSGRHFDAWWKSARRSQPDLLSFSAAMLVTEAADRVTEAEYPTAWRQGELELPLTYQFEPGTAADGVTVHVPLTLLNRVRDEGFDWQVPGLREELVTALIRSLPKGLRRGLVPAPDHARAALAALAADQAGPAAVDAAFDPSAEPLLDALERELGRAGGTPIPRDAWDLDRVPAHLRMTFRVEDGERVVGEGKDLAALQRRLAPKLQQVISAASSDLERSGLTGWPADLPGGGELPRVVEPGPGRPVRGFPALVDEGETAAVRVLGSPAAQERAMAAGTRRLLWVALRPASAVRQEMAALPNDAKLALSRAPHGDVAALVDDVAAAVLDSLVAAHGGPAWDAGAFAALSAATGADLPAAVRDAVGLVARVLGAWQGVQSRLKGTASLTLLPALTDVRAQVDALVYPGFVAATGRARLPDLVRYLQAADRRLDRMPDNPGRDRALMARVEQARGWYEDAVRRLPPGVQPGPELVGVRWMLEELRVSLFAQPLRTAYPVSEQRIRAAIARAAG
jgi:ATP-dependent helicase HrpA